MNDAVKNRIVKEIVDSIDIPEYAYEKADIRYKDLGEWFGRKDARCYAFDPHIYSQGSFRLGTVIRPIDDDGEYDLDMGCRLRNGITKDTHTQQQLKALVGADLEDYRVARGIKEKKEEKHRCWRLKYADKLKFHLDTVPSIPENTYRIGVINEAMVSAGTPAALSALVASLTGAITDNRLWNFKIIDDAWRISNSEGFALWFESRMKLAKALLESIALREKVAKVEDLPAYRWKTPLQRCVQLLKRHRDIFFYNDEDSKPASIIITTLSAMAYQGENEIGSALETILFSMGKFINSTSPRVPNPVNPEEDFADRWSDSGSIHLNLEAKFRKWLRQAQTDFQSIWKAHKPEIIVDIMERKVGASLNIKTISTIIGGNQTGGLLKSAAVPAGLSFPDKPLVPKRPEKFARMVSK
ncbi:MAG: nucleotidyltransferase [Desulfobacterales bacterium]